MAHRTSHGFLRSFGLAQLAPILYFAAAAWQGSGMLVAPREASTACMTPAHLGWSYEAINYRPETDRRLLAETDPMDCASPPAPAGDELITVDGVPLAGWWIPAVDPGSPRTTVVMVHGYVDNKSGMLRYAAIVHRSNDVVLFDLRNSGQSGGRRTTQGVGEQRDVAAVLDWLYATHQPERVVVFGQSMGGAAAVAAVVADSRVDALILDSTHDRLRTPVSSGFASHGLPFADAAYPIIIELARWRSGELLSSVDPIDLVAGLGDRPLLLLHGGEDRVDPLDSARRLHEAARDGGVESTLQVCRSAGHGTLDQSCSGAYRSWIANFLAGSPPAG